MLISAVSQTGPVMSVRQTVAPGAGLRSISHSQTDAPRPAVVPGNPVPQLVEPKVTSIANRAATGVSPGGFGVLVELEQQAESGSGLRWLDVVRRLERLDGNAFEVAGSGLREVSRSSKPDPFAATRPVLTVQSVVYESADARFELLYERRGTVPRHVLIDVGRGQLAVSLVDYDMVDENGDSMKGRVQWVRARNRYGATFKSNSGGTSVCLPRHVFFDDGAIGAGPHIYRRVFSPGAAPVVTNLVPFLNGDQDLVLRLPGREQPWTFDRHRLEPKLPAGYDGPRNFLGLPGPLRIG